MTKTKNAEKESIKDIIKDFPNHTSEIIPLYNSLLQAILGGGIELGSMIEITGETGTGKSTIALEIARELCVKDKNILYIDTEGSISEKLLKSVEVQSYINDKLFYVRSNTFQKVENIMDRFINTGEIHCIIVDSLAGLIHSGFTDILDKKKISITTNQTNYDSKRLNLFMKKYNAIAKMKNICFILVNQHRNQVDMKKGTIVKNYGSKAVTYFADIILKIKNQKASTDFKKITDSIGKGIALEIEIVKSNKHRPESFPFYLLYGKGISNIISDIYALIQMGVVTQNNGYYSISKFKVHGIKEFYDYYKTFLMENEEIKNKLANYYENL